MLLNKIIEFTYHNPIDKIAEENEDALEIKTDNNLQIKQVAISDGAGGAGIYCKEWANFIVKNAPSLEEAKVNIDNWLLETSKKFYFEYKDQISDDSFTKEKFLSIGSYATFLFLWIDLKNKILFYTGVGDSSVFVLRKIEERYVPVLIFPLDKNEFIDQNPQLINWKKKNIIENDIRVFQLETDDIILAGTDAVSRWILSNLLILSKEETRRCINPNFKIDNQDLVNIETCSDNIQKVEDIYHSIPGTNNEIKDYFVNLVQRGCIEADDLTLYAEVIL